jgi:uracil-DNA glycosylase family 4
MQGDTAPQLRAWVEYFRDLGVHDFYRRGEMVARPATESDSNPPTQHAALADTVPTEAGVSLATTASAATSVSDAAPALQSAAISPEQQLMKLISFNDLAPIPAESIPPADRPAALNAIQEDIGDCTRCPLSYAGRHKIVFADGSPTARLMFVGEGPGADEDAQGLPFVGKAGQLLNNMITAMGLARSEVYIANVVKCRPPGNRVPEPVEANTCSQFLLRQIDVVRPEVIVALGATAAMYLLGVKRSLSGLRGYWHTCRGAKLAVTYHPAFLLRDPRQKAEAWKDLQMVMAELGLKVPGKS